MALTYKSAALSRRDDLESLAYSIFALYADGLPWHNEEQSTKILRMKQIWQKSGALQGTCEFPLGDLLHYAQSLDFFAEPDYDGWRDAFWRVDNAAVDFPQSDPLYDPTDTTEAVPRNMLFIDWQRPVGNVYDIYLREESNMGRMHYAPGSSHGYRPDSSGWTWPLTMKPEDTMGGGQDLIREFVQHISQPPTTTFPSLAESCDPEVMRGFDDPIPFKIFVEVENNNAEGEYELESCRKEEIMEEQTAQKED
uniref:Protein kinase domain-containing protein n=1 Tax=Ganoderma boninense TaxID=34458 RepID=A0A5K1JSQ7_9APHY|nr:Protein kinase domain-containing protein [Ganoderma boninense]